MVGRCVDILLMREEWTYVRGSRGDSLGFRFTDASLQPQVDDHVGANLQQIDMLVASGYDFHSLEIHSCMRKATQ